MNKLEIRTRKLVDMAQAEFDNTDMAEGTEDDNTDMPKDAVLDFQLRSVLVNSFDRHSYEDCQKQLDESIKKDFKDIQNMAELEFFKKLDWVEYTTGTGAVNKKEDSQKPQNEEEGQINEPAGSDLSPERRKMARQGIEEVLLKVFYYNMMWN